MQALHCFKPVGIVQFKKNGLLCEIAAITTKKSSNYKLKWQTHNQDFVR